ncbi:hypothetical protein XcodCFBP4690_09110 [Xanthomonas codiaei]|uniref:Uncharacterized protein n=1 Tax=Xanthomonas codiaei TaxID=56463 RepID=A0A2S7CRY4_9XANT|nr:hypothetical protein XcodCFBP4690_09110 [Xanthomonas codiaei]
MPTCFISLKAASCERDPWLIVASPQLHTPSSKQLISVHARRMQFVLSHPLLFKLAILGTDTGSPRP